MDPKEPILSAPPREPVDVTITPDSPPAKPFDVPVQLSAAPREPFDVPIFPDAPPTAPFDVPTFPDGPPGSPFDVGVIQSGPPASPVDVPTVPSQPPAGPFDVPVSPDAPPVEPFDVATAPDLPPVEPIDVQTLASAPPGVPFDVAVQPDGPAAEPFDVQVGQASPPAEPFDVQITADEQIDPNAVWIGPTPGLGDASNVQIDKNSFAAGLTIIADEQIDPNNVWIGPTGAAGDSNNVQIPKDRFEPKLMIDNGDPGVPSLPYPLSRNPSIEEIIRTVEDYDGVLASFLYKLIDIDPVTAAVPGGGALDPRLLGEWLKTYHAAVGASGMARFVAEQTILYAMNPVTARVFDPTYFLKMLIPGSMGHAHTTIDTQTGGTMETFALVRDEILQRQVFASQGRQAGNGRADSLDVYAPNVKYTDGQAYSVDSLVDAALGNSVSPFLKTEVRAGQSVSRFDASQFFDDRRSDGSMIPRNSARLRAAIGVENVSTSRLARSSAIDGIIPVGVPGEQTDGSVLSVTQNPSDVVDDDDARLPISFTDVRQVPGERFRSVYFRPENVAVGMSYAPEYSDSSAFGRVDPIIGYQRTTRTVNLSFEVHAFAPEDLQLMYNKMTWLSSMVYPSYGNDSLMRSGPVTRIRIGDLVATDLGGVAGVIRSLNFDFAEAMWELQRGMKVPRSYKVSLDFLCLHDGPVGTVAGAFGVFQLPPGGTTPGPTTNMSDNPTQSREEPSKTATRMPGRFFKFGEPRK